MLLFTHYYMGPGVSSNPLTVDRLKVWQSLEENWATGEREREREREGRVGPGIKNKPPSSIQASL